MSDYLQRFAQNQAQKGAAQSYGFQQSQQSIQSNQFLQEQMQAPNGVQLCKRPAQIPGADLLDLVTDAKHHWLSTDNFERGMGPATGGVPGQEKSPDMPFTPTTVNDHTGQKDQENSVCKSPKEWDPVRWAETDLTCVENEMALGAETGRWTPLLNDCQVWAADVLDKCSTPALEPSATSGVCASGSWSSATHE